VLSPECRHFSDEATGRSVCLAYPLNDHNFCLVPSHSSATACSGRTVAGPTLLGAGHRPARVAGPGRQRRFVRYTAAAGVSVPARWRRPRAGAAGMVSGGHRRSSQRCAWTPPAVAASDRSAGVRRFCGQPPACMLARPRVLRQRPQGSGWSGRQPLAVPAGAGSPGTGVAFVDRPDGVRASDGRDKCVLWPTSVPGRQRRVQPGAAWSPTATPGYRPAALHGELGRRTLWAVPPLSATEGALPLLLVDRSLATRPSTPPPYFRQTFGTSG